MPADSPERPLPNTYWVLPGELLAGEHPRRNSLSSAGARERLRRLMDAGIDSFVDLTLPDELEAYDADLPPGVRYARRPIRDHGIPARPEHMTEILAYIEGELRGGRRVYVHCQAGIGRTGTVAGCLLIERGAIGDGALTELNRLWRACDRSRTWPNVPETDEQIAFVRNWRTGMADTVAQLTAIPPRAPSPRGRRASERGVEDRFHGALLGLAVGDALGITNQGLKAGTFAPVTGLVGGGALSLPAGAWSDDTAMALCVAEGFVECGRFDPRDQVERFERWQQEGHLSSTGKCVGITPNSAQALASARWRRQIFPGSHDPKHLDPEVLSRVAPAVMFAFDSLEDALHLACETSRITCQSPGALDACRLFAASLHCALAAEPKDRVLDPPWELQDHTGVRERVTSIRARAGSRPVRAGATAADALAAALWAFETTATFHEGALRAANLGGCSDVVGAAYGQIAGAFYGAEAIPGMWREAIARRDLIETLAVRLSPASQRR